MTAPSESVAAKAARLLAAGRLTVLEVQGDVVRAACQGDTGTYALGHHPRVPGRCRLPPACREREARIMTTIGPGAVGSAAGHVWPSQRTNADRTRA